MLVTLAMWIHVVLNSLVCYKPTENPIWGELRLLSVIVSTLGLWVAVAAII